MKKGILVRIKHCKFEGSNYVGSFSHIVSSEFGYGSYCGSHCNLFHINIGRFCSIASNVDVIFGNHPISNFVSTHPAFYAPKTSTGLSFCTECLFDEITYSDSDHDFYVSVGNDVWIGSHVKLISGIRIGDGAVIAAGSVVTKDVEPYSIVGGVPAHIIKYRFAEKDIQVLLKEKWWDKDIKWIKSNASLFSNINLFKQNLESKK